MNETVIASMVNDLQARVKFLEGALASFEERLDKVIKATDAYHTKLQPKLIDPQDIFKILEEDKEILKKQIAFKKELD